MPPWINKFYILDLQPKNSFIKWLRRPGQHGVRGLLGQPGRAAPDTALGRLHASEGRWQRWVRSSRRPASAQANVIGYCIGGTLLGGDAGLTWRPGRRPASRPPPSSPRSRTSRTRASSRCSSTRSSSPSIERADGGEGLSRRQLHGADLQPDARQRPDLVVRGQQLPPGQGAGAVRPPALERRQHPHAGGDPPLLPAQHVPEEPAEGAGRNQRSRACRSTCARWTHRSSILSAREDHIAPWPQHLCRRPASTAARSGSCWRARAISRAWSIPPARPSMAIGPTRTFRARPEAWLAGAARAPGLVVAGTGPSGSRSMPAAR